MVYNLLAEGNGGWTNYLMWGLVAVLVVVVVVWFVFSGRKNKQRQQEYVEQLDAIRPGNKVKTAGGICGVVVEVCDDNTVIIETGSETVGKSYVKMDKELIAQTDAKGPTQIAREEAEARKKAEREARAAEKADEAQNGQSEESANEVPQENEVHEEPEEVPSENKDKE